MSALGEFSVPLEGFLLKNCLSAVEDIRVEITRVVSSKDFITPYFWAAGEDLDDFEREIRQNGSVGSVERLENQDVNEDADLSEEEERFYNIQWHMEVPDFIAAVRHVDGTVLEATVENPGDWMVTVLFPNHEALSAFHDYTRKHGIRFDTRRLYSPENAESRGSYGVTEAQQEALEAAFHAGYFAVPRKTNLTELADQLELSRNALSTRLRRGHRNLLANTLVHEES